MLGPSVNNTGSSTEVGKAASNDNLRVGEAVAVQGSILALVRCKNLAKQL
jgi:hypothetical protein